MQQLAPTSILDVGVGFGKWGHLFREYSDIVASEHDAERYRRENWKVRIDGIEGFPGYVTEMHRYLYDEIHLGQALEVLPTLGRYDLVFFGDIIEHFERADGLRVIDVALDHADKAVMLTTPRYETHQGGLCGNELERHRSLWTPGDFLCRPGAQVTTVDRTTLVAVIAQPGVGVPVLAPRISGRPPSKLRRGVGKLARAVVGEDRWRRWRGGAGGDRRDGSNR